MAFVDTNVLLYAVSPEPDEQEKSRRVQPVTTAVVCAALTTRERYRISYWDAAIIEASRALGCDVVLSEDRADYGGVRVENPFRGL